MRPYCFRVARTFEVSSSVKHYVISNAVIYLGLLGCWVCSAGYRVEPSLIVAFGF
jgi:hypothetical protein